MPKVDFKKELKHLYGPSSRAFSVVDVPPLCYLMIDGQGDPNTALEYQQALEALYAVAYTLKFVSKRQLEKDYVVPPLEGLWWADDMAAFAALDKGSWRWTAMIMQPEWVSEAMVGDAVREASAQKALPALDKMRFELYEEGLSVQIMHIGPYDEEAPTIARLHNEFLPAQGYAEAGKHHEIYLSDPRRTAPERLRTVLRQPVRASGAPKV